MALLSYILLYEYLQLPAINFIQVDLAKKFKNLIIPFLITRNIFMTSMELEVSSREKLYKGAKIAIEMFLTSLIHGLLKEIKFSSNQFLENFLKLCELAFF